MFYENFAWFTVLWVSLLIVRRLRRAAHPRVPASVSSSKSKTARPLKPRTPTDCPVCGRPHSTPRWGDVCKLPASRDVRAPPAAHIAPRLGELQDMSALASTKWISDNHLQVRREKLTNVRTKNTRHVFGAADVVIKTAGTNKKRACCENPCSRLVFCIGRGRRDSDPRSRP